MLIMGKDFKTLLVHVHVVYEVIDSGTDSVINKLSNNMKELVHKYLT